MVPHPVSKRIKISDDPRSENEIKLPEKLPEMEKCKQCNQYTDQLLFYNGHPNNSREEIITLTNEKLMLFTGKEKNIHEADKIPSFKITHFSVYDKMGHLCAFDTGLIEKNVHLLMSGYVKPIYEENPTPDDGFPTHDIGPINNWWTAGFDSDENLIVGVCSAYAEYYFMDPSPEYEPFWKNIFQKVLVWKFTIVFLIEECHTDPPYEDLLQHLESSGRFEQPEEVLISNAQFVCEQIDNYYDEPPEDEPPLITLSCIRSLIKLSGITFKGKGKIRKIAQDIKKKTKQFTKATTTQLVHTIFENIFPDQLDDKSGDGKGHKSRRCGVCEACQQPDCGTCAHCKNKLKFGGRGTAKQSCKNRKCPYMQDLDSDDEGEDRYITNGSSKHKYSKRIINSKVEWVNEPVEHNKIKYYECVTVGDIVINRGDFVMLNADSPNEPLCIAEVVLMFEVSAGQKMFHANILCRGSDTILGETSDPRELFVVNECEDCPLGAIVRKAEVEFRNVPKNWEKLGGTLELPPQLEDNGCTFFVNKRFEKELSRFIDYNKESKDESPSYNYCESCKNLGEKKEFETATLEDNKITWRGKCYKEGTAVFLNPEVYDFRKSLYFDEFQDDEIEDINEDIYPEYFRKKNTIKGSNFDTPKPFHVAVIDSIQSNKQNIKIKVKLLCRPDDTKNALFLAYKESLNCLYWTDIIITTEFTNVTGKCYLAYGGILENVDDWVRSGPYRFYFNQSYDFQSNSFGEVPSHASTFGFCGKGKRKSKGKNKSSGKVDNYYDLPPVWDKAEPLRCMDVFAGCGGLSEGLHQAGIAETKWAIEKEHAPAQAFRLNYPDCKVFHDDCNDILKQVMNGEVSRRGLPQKGEVELLCGGPPCQGFSGMNRFNAGQYSLFKNSLIVSYLSYCDYYRPKYFILENVRNFVSFKRSMVLKLTIRCLLAMGYQVTFGVLQAGNYGVPQTRRRFIIMAAAPGYILPTYPEPQHVFNKRGCQLSFVVNETRYFNGTNWTEAAPFRTICVRDAMSDLPDISSGWNRLEMPYYGEAVSHYQKMMRGDIATNLVKDHICKEMSAIVEARIAHVPTYHGADWRDLPNIEVKLKDGNMANKLRYSYRKKNQSSKEPKRGVCSCYAGEACDPTDRQNNTLIPWCLPHTADRHNHWAGLYGRLEWDGFFGTTITNPEPISKQGRVLHPEQNRVVSVRECARSQGFPDRFKFYGNILDKHRQIGNAVPPPLAYALGKQMCKAYAETLKTKKN